jgi:type II restriction/modification system DNA methylase subunit YeeA
MNKNNLKSYAPQARRDFMRAVSDRAALLGLSPDVPSTVEVSGDVVIINGQAHPRSVAVLRERLLERIKQEGWQQFVEEIAYTWFNRFTALRFMELNGFLSHGLRVLSNPDESKDEPEILEKAHTVELPGLTRERVVELKLAANKEAELYRLLLVAQCNQLHTAMPFLFERINDETELLLPDNLLHSDSVIRKLVAEIAEDDWRQVEIIGWLYQFYISERKDEVIGKVVKSEDIPAATQLFTPNWIVKYMTQNSLGQMWLQTYPDSGLRAKMDYYIEPAEQSEEVKRELAKLAPASINPEEIKILDPACGSGHILVEAYGLLKEIYRERGYSSRDIPRFILEKNLYGLDIDERASQLASFALLMKARGDDRRILEDAPRLNVLAIEESTGVKTEELVGALLQVRSQPRAVPIVGEDNLWGDVSRQGAFMVAAAAVEEATAASSVSREEIVDLLELFREGKTLGSLISVPDEMVRKLPAMRGVVEENLNSGELYAREASNTLLPFVRQAEVLAGKYSCVIANPPYMGSKGMNADLKEFAKRQFPDSKSDLFAMFVERSLEQLKPHGQAAFVTPFVWMFISSYEKFRKNLIEKTPLSSLIQLEYNAFEPACVPVCTFTMKKNGNSQLKGEFIKLSDFKGYQNQAPKTLEAIKNPNCGWRFQASTADFEKISGSPIAYWVSDKVREIFENGTPLGEIADLVVGLQTGDNGRFLRLWFETDFQKIGLNFDSRVKAQESKLKWFPVNKGGEFRKWYGNNEYIINWENDGQELYSFQPYSVIRNSDFYFKQSVTWSKIGSSFFAVRYNDRGFIINDASCSALSKVGKIGITELAGFLCSIIAFKVVNILNPTLNLLPSTVSLSPILEVALEEIKPQVNAIVEEAIAIACADWDSFETSWDFQMSPLIHSDLKAATVKESINNWLAHCNANIRRMQELETENNRLFIEAYGLQDELSPEVTEEQITLARADASADTRRLVSYAVGCMMGRYSLDEPGLIYAQSGGTGFDPSHYSSFPADADGIIPVTDLEWFDDDAASRFSEFVRRTWGDETYAQNLAWIAAQLGAKSGEMPVETSRRYFSVQFFKDHMQTYKKRPIYWLFSSGKQKAFECLVYLHRYNESTLSRMRNEYVTPLMGKLAARIEHATKERDDATTGSAKNKLQKQLDVLLKKQHELAAFDEQLRHYADQRIHIDLDDGVRANYGKFGTLLAEVKAIAAASE